MEREGKVFQGGLWRDLHSILQVKSGSQVLYVGDHMYSDVVRSKRDLGWRTTLIIPELDHELRVGHKSSSAILEMATHSAEYEEAEAEADDLCLRLLQDDADPGLPASMADANLRIEEARDALRNTRERLHATYHPQWGPIFETGLHSSRFAKQVADYACTYTSHVTNLANYSPLRSSQPVY